MTHTPLLPRMVLVLGLCITPWTPLSADGPETAGMDLQMEQLCLRIEQGDATAHQAALERIAQLQQDQKPDRKLLRRSVARLVYASLTNMPNGPREETLAAIEKIELNLRTSYPEQSESDEALLHLAEAHTSSTDAVRIAQDLVERIATPTHIRCRAMALVQRHKLLGKQIAEVWPEQVHPLASIYKSKSSTIIYSWKNGPDATFGSLRERLSQYPKGTQFVGVNLDEAPERSTALAARLNLPGIQMTRGADLIAARFGLATENVLIHVDGEGTIAAVNEYALHLANAGIK